MQTVDQARRELDRLCTAHEISSDVAFALLIQVEFLLIHRHEIAPNRSTVTDRVKQLDAVADCATRLQQAVKALEFNDRCALDSEFFKVDESAFERISELARGSEVFDLGAFEIPAIRQAAVAIRNRISGVGKAGSQSTAEIAADYIRCVAQAVAPAGIEPSHGGLFRQICEAVFNAAGVALPERAMRYFMEDVWPAFQGRRTRH